MDKAEPANEVAEEVTRESLISISYSLPEKIPNLTPSLEKLNEETLFRVDSDGEEKCRSELISISYTESPDNVGVEPVDPNGELKG